MRLLTCFVSNISGIVHNFLSKQCANWKVRDLHLDNSNGRQIYVRKKNMGRCRFGLLGHLWVLGLTCLFLASLAF